MDVLAGLLRLATGRGSSPRTETQRDEGSMVRIVVIWLFVLFVLSGCGPGFPIMTEEQERLINDVNRLSKENRDLKKRLARVEKALKDSFSQIQVLKKDLKKALVETGTRQDIARLAEDTEEIKKSLEGLDIQIKQIRADTNARFEGIQKDFSFVRGGLEEAGYERKQLRDKITILRDSLKKVEERFQDVEKEMKDTPARMEELRHSFEQALTEKEALLEESIESINATIDSIKESIDVLKRDIHRLSERMRDVKTAGREPEKPQGPDPGALYMKGYRQIAKDHDYIKGLETLRQFLKLFPEHEFADNAQYWMGEAYYAMGDWERAIVEFDRVIKNYPKGDKVAAALLKQGFAFEKLDAKDEARVLLKRVIEKFPGSKEADKAKRRLRALK